VGINAFLNLIPHARKKHVDFKQGIIFSIPGIIGVLLGAELGLITPGSKLLFIFGILMIIIAAYMLKRKCVEVAAEPVHNRSFSKMLSMGVPRRLCIRVLWYRRRFSDSPRFNIFRGSEYHTGSWDISYICWRIWNCHSD